MALGERLRYARHRAGLTGAQVSQRTGIGGSSLSEFENGKREPRISQLAALAREYQRSIAFLLSDTPMPTEVVLWRQRPPAAAQELEANFLRLCEQYHNLETWCGEEVQARLPSAAGTAAGYRYSHAENLAMSVRGELRLGERPGQELIRVLEEVCGVKVFHREFEPTGTAASTISGTFGAAVLLNSRNVRWRRNFDLAHELFHLVTWALFRSESETSSCVASEWEQKLATCFASNLLMPAEATLAAVNSRMRDGKVPVGDLPDIARQFDVSVESLLWRLHILYRRPQEDSESTRREIERANALAPEREDTPPPKWPERYRALAVKALRRGEFATGRFAQYLEIGRQEAMSYLEQEFDDDGEVQVAPA